MNMIGNLIIATTTDQGVASYIFYILSETSSNNYLTTSISSKGNIKRNYAVDKDVVHCKTNDDYWKYDIISI